MRNWLKTLLFLSSFSPVLLALAYVRYDIYGLQVEVIQLCVISLLGMTLPILIMTLVDRSSESLNIDVKKVESNDFMLFAFVASYFTPIVSRASDVDFLTTVFIASVMVAILWATSYMPSHPLLRLLSFRFYKIESSNGIVYTLIAKRDIRDPRSITQVKKLSSTMLMESNKCRSTCLP